MEFDSQNFLGPWSGIGAFLFKILVSVLEYDMRLKRPFIFVRRILDRPYKVLILCCLFLGMNFIFSGNIYRLWNLDVEHKKMLHKIEKNKEGINLIGQELARLKDPAYLERQAIDKLGLVESDSLIFVFPTESGSSQ